MIYFITNKDSNHVKIGYSRNPQQRLCALQTSASSKLELICHIEGDFKLEHYIHKKFEHIKIKNEWFQHNEEIIDFIDFIRLEGITKYYIIYYFDLYKKSNERLLEIFKLGIHYKSYFDEELLKKYQIILKSNFNNYYKAYLIKLIFDNNLDYNRLNDDIQSNWECLF